MKQNGKAVTFTEHGQTYINLNEDNANVIYITEQVKEKDDTSSWKWLGHRR